MLRATKFGQQADKERSKPNINDVEAMDKGVKVEKGLLRAMKTQSRDQ